jgi:multiple sugar transport system permease protein
MKKSTPYLLLLPALIFTFFVLGYPLIQNLVNSFREVSLIRGSGGWTGLKNYAGVVEDPLFWLSFRNTLVYAVSGTAISVLVGLGCAVLLNERVGRITDIAGFLFTIPWVLSPVVAGFAWKWLLNDRFGIINYWLIQAGLVKEGITWLGDPHTALAGVIVARVWQFFPFAMVMILACLQTIPDEEYEAASVDGAGPLKKFMYITLPHLRSVGAVMLLLGVIWSFNDFNMVFVMTRGGPINSSMVLPVLVREYSFVHFDLGKGSALSVMVFVMLVSLSALYLRVLAERDHV